MRKFILCLLALLCISCVTTTKFSSWQDLYSSDKKIGLYVIAAPGLFDDGNLEFEKLASDLNERFLNQIFDNGPTRVVPLNSELDRKKVFLEFAGGWNIDEKIIAGVGTGADCDYSIVIFYNYSGLFKKKIENSDYYTGFVYNLWILRNRDAKTVFNFISKGNNFEDAIAYWRKNGHLAGFNDLQKYKTFLTVNTFSAMESLQMDKQFEIQMKELNSVGN